VFLAGRVSRGIKYTHTLIFCSAQPLPDDIFYHANEQSNPVRKNKEQRGKYSYSGWVHFLGKWLKVYWPQRLVGQARRRSGASKKPSPVGGRSDSKLKEIYVGGRSSLFFITLYSGPGDLLLAGLLPLLIVRARSKENPLAKL